MFQTGKEILEKPQTNKNVNRVSPSSLNLMLDCSRCFWQSKINRLNRPRDMIPAIPIKMHSMIEQYFNYYRELGQLPPMIKNTIIKGTIARDMPKTLSYTDKHGITLWGRPDTYIQQSDKTIIPLDHKTKSKSPDITIHPGVQIQLSVYSYLLHKMGYKTTPRAYVVYYYPGDNIQLHKGMKLECKVVKTSTNYGLVETLMDEANRVLHGPIPRSSKSCIYCRWKQEDN